MVKLQYLKDISLVCSLFYLMIQKWKKNMKSLILCWILVVSHLN